MSLDATPAAIGHLHGLQLRARSIVEGYVAGLHRSPFHGYSIEFAEHREYAPGDDLRYVDWKLFGRTDKYYVKQYEDETNLICYLVLDISESMGFRGQTSALSKFEYAQCLAASLAWFVLQQRDAVSLITFDDRVRSSIAASSSPSHWRQILDTLESSRPTGVTRAGAVFHAVAEQLPKRGVVILLSDFFEEIGSLTAGLRHLRHQRHDVAAWQILDAAELDFPFQEPTLFRGLEGGPRVATDPASLRAAYQAELRNFLTGVRGVCQERDIEYRLTRTDSPFDNELSQFLSLRMARARR